MKIKRTYCPNCNPRQQTPRTPAELTLNSDRKIDFLLSLGSQFILKTTTLGCQSPSMSDINRSSISNTSRLSESSVLRSHCLLSLVETPHYGPCFPAHCAGKRSLRLFSICTHILGVLPSRQIALLAPPDVVSPDSSSVLCLLPCSSAPVCHRPGPQTETPRQTGTAHSEPDGLSFVEGRDRRVTVLATSISLPPENPTKVSDLHRLLSAEYGA